MPYLLLFFLYVHFLSRFLSHVSGLGCSTEMCVRARARVAVRFAEIKYNLFCDVLTCSRLSFRRREKVKFQWEFYRTTFVNILKPIVCQKCLRLAVQVFLDLRTGHFMNSLVVGRK
jgi:hypothetical protein